ncbi:MAG: hypothetical protein K2P51_06220 [Rhabdochlamydiaceae bacterium]|nr:hypothetical protein [Rhabdochlamydiaceae bacterium]
MDISLRQIEHTNPTPAIETIAKNEHDKGLPGRYITIGIVAAAIFATWILVTTPFATLAKTVVVAPIVFGIGLMAGFGYLIYRHMQS